MDLTLFIQLLISGILLGGVYALASIGLTLIFGVMKVVNFAHGEFFMVAMYLAYWAVQYLHLDPYLATLVAVPVVFLIGIVTYYLFIRPTLSSSVLAQIFITVGLSTIIQNMVLLFWSADFRSISVSYATESLVLGPFAALRVEEIMISPIRLIAFALAILLSVAFYLFLKFSYTGKIIRATAQDRSAALLMGINTDKIYRLTFAIGIVLVGLAGGLVLPVYSVQPFVGFDFVLIMFVVVVLGGMGSVVGAMISGLIIGVVEVFSSYWIGQENKQIIYFLVFIAILVVRPSGLFGLREEEELEHIETID
ncbi:MAG TPA: branched-chain amino acid ABC transporter permease [Syntrophorhabdales bacterium]|nr:branched-chain amino acid ABC transporter permease [Syntrophorhabdales bacterium]